MIQPNRMGSANCASASARLPMASSTPQPRERTEQREGAGIDTHRDMAGDSRTGQASKPAVAGCSTLRKPEARGEGKAIPIHPGTALMRSRLCRTTSRTTGETMTERSPWVPAAEHRVENRNGGGPATGRGHGHPRIGRRPAPCGASGRAGTRRATPRPRQRATPSATRSIISAASSLSPP